MLVLLLIVAVSVSVSFLCSLLESVLYSTRITTIEAEAQKGSGRAVQMQALKAEVEKPLAAILILNTVANTAGAALAGWAAGEVMGADGLVVFSICFTVTILFGGEIIPKTLAAVHWPRLWQPAVPLLKAMCLVLKPLIWLTRAVTRLITRGRAQASAVSEDEIVAAASLSATGGEISKLERDLIQNIINLENLRATDILTPRTVMLSLDGATPLGEARLMARSWSYTRVPVYRDTPENIVGYVLKSAILATGPDADQRPVRELAKPIRFVPGSVNALDLLHGFLRRREHVAVVVDEFGGILGVVTLEDVVESLVGSEIVDETDQVDDLQALARRRAAQSLQSRNEPGEGGVG